MRKELIKCKLMIKRTHDQINTNTSSKGKTLAVYCSHLTTKTSESNTHKVVKKCTTKT